MPETLKNEHAPTQTCQLCNWQRSYWGIPRNCQPVPQIQRPMLTSLYRRRPNGQSDDQNSQLQWLSHLPLQSSNSKSRHASQDHQPLFWPTPGRSVLLVTSSYPSSSYFQEWLSPTQHREVTLVTHNPLSLPAKRLEKPEIKLSHAALWRLMSPRWELQNCNFRSLISSLHRTMVHPAYPCLSG